MTDCVLGAPHRRRLTNHGMRAISIVAFPLLHPTRQSSTGRLQKRYKSPDPITLKLYHRQMHMANRTVFKREPMIVYRPQPTDVLGVPRSQKHQKCRHGLYAQPAQTWLFTRHITFPQLRHRTVLHRQPIAVGVRRAGDRLSSAGVFYTCYTCAASSRTMWLQGQALRTTIRSCRSPLLSGA